MSLASKDVRVRVFNGGSLDHETSIGLINAYIDGDIEGLTHIVYNHKESPDINDVYSCSYINNEFDYIKNTLDRLNTGTGV